MTWQNLEKGHLRVSLLVPHFLLTFLHLLHFGVTLSTSDIVIILLLFLYAVIVVLCFIAYAFGPPEGPYANAKTVLFSLFWPVILVTLQLWRFVRWVTKP